MIPAKERLIRLHRLFAGQFGIDLLKAGGAIRYLPRYLRDISRFRALYSGRLEYSPCLHDWSAEAGTAKSEYFWQDLLVARSIYRQNPERHVDVGSRLDGFIAHVASFREIEVFDIRPISVSIPGVVFRQADVATLTSGMNGYCDSLSCLHALEHFGLGRYGDGLDARGYSAALRNMSRLLTDGGTFYLSIPMGLPRIDFNAERIFDPHAILDECRGNGLQLSEMTIIPADGAVYGVQEDDEAYAKLAASRRKLVLLTFRKRNEARGAR